MTTLGQNTDDGLPTIIDQNGNVRVLARTSLNAGSRRLRASTTSFTSWLRSLGMDLIPRNLWRPIDRRQSLGVQFINDQERCSGCVGWSGVQAFMRQRALRGLRFVKLSGAFLYAHINGNRDAGAVITDVIPIITQIGVCTQESFDLPHLYRKQIPPAAITEAGQFKMAQALTLDSFDEIGTALQMNLIPQFPVRVDRNFENFDADGVAGFARGPGNHAVHADGMKKNRRGAWLLDIPNSWTPGWGPNRNGRCFISENHINATALDDDAVVYIDPEFQPGDMPPVPTV